MGPQPSRRASGFDSLPEAWVLSGGLGEMAVLTAIKHNIKIETFVLYLGSH